MKKPTFLIAFFVFFATNIFAQDLQKKPNESPLECAFYLHWKKKPDDRNSSAIDPLKDAFFEINLYEDVIRTINLLEDTEDSSYFGERVSKFAWLSTTLLKDGKINEANKFLTEAVKNINLEDAPDKYALVELTQNLIELNRADEAVNIAKMFADEFEENDVTLAVAEKFLKLGQTEKLRAFLAQTFFPHESEDNPTRARVALIFAKLKQPEKAKKILEELKQTAFFGDSDLDANNNRREILFPLLQIHLELGEAEKAFELWNQRGDQEDFYEISAFIDILIAYGQKEKVSLLLAQMQSDKEQFEREGFKVVEIYLKIGDVESALYAAKTMSENNDNYWQQDSFVKLADRFIADKNAKAAENILDFAFQRARKIVFQHDSMDSNGASSGTRKRTYLRNIYQRMMKLKRYNKAFTVIDSINNNDSIAKEFVAESLADFVGQQIKTLSRKRIDAILTQIQTIFTDEDDKDNLIKARLLTAGIYAKMGEKTKAVEIVTKVLEEAQESSYREEDILLSAGKIFEQNKLQANANLKKILKKFIADAE